MPDAVGPALTRGRLSRVGQPNLLVEELVLRPWEPADAPVVVTAFTDPEMQRWHFREMTPGEASAWLASCAVAWTAETGADWAVIADSAVVGRIGLHDVNHAQGSAEVAYCVLPAARGRHTTARALKALTGWAFGQVGFHRLELSHAVGNTASCRVATRAGFIHEGTRRAQELHPDGWHDTHMHACLATDLEPG